MKKTLIAFSLILTFLITPTSASAFSFSNLFSNFFSQPKVVSPSAKKPAGNIKLIKVKGQYVKKQNIVKVEFDNLENVKSLSYSLSYTSKGISQGVMDSLIPNRTKKYKKDVFLGSCSGKVCVPHTNAANIKLTVEGTYTNGKTFSQSILVK